MCGICGIYHNDRSCKVNRQLVEDMNDLLDHRGPDDEGYYFNANIGMGMRLSLIHI